METLFIFPEAGTRHAHLDEWLAKHDNEIGQIARILVDRVRSCGDDIRELVHDGRPTLCVEMAAFAYVDTYSRHAAIGFFEGASLPDPEKLFQGQGKRMRHIKLRTLDEVALPSLLMMIDAAYHDMRRRLGLD